MELSAEKSYVLEGPQQQMQLPNSEAAAQYYKLIRRSLPMMLNCLAMHGTPQLDKNIYEGEVVSNMIHRLLYSASALEMKYAFQEGNDLGQHLSVVLEGSGFPSYVDVDGIAVDLLHRDVTLKEMQTSEERLKKMLLDVLINEHREPQVILEELAKRTYLEMLDPNKLFLPYTQGQLIPWKTNEKDVRGYLFSWGAYSVALNCPLIHLMFMTQDLSEQPFEEGGPNLAEFLDVIKEEGSHVPEKLYILAKVIDERLDPVHPKVLKRVRVGPLYAPFLLNARAADKLSETELALKSLFDRMGQPDDFAMLFTEEMTFSKEQILASRYLFKRVVQEVFYVPLLDEDIDVNRYLLMPHRFYREILPEEAKYIPRLSSRLKFSYDQKEQLNEVS